MSIWIEAAVAGMVKKKQMRVRAKFMGIHDPVLVSVT